MLYLVIKIAGNPENTKVFVGALSVTSCILLYRFTLGYAL